MEKEWKAYEIGELDQYLFGQGNHYEIYKKLGAHLVQDGKQKGVYFAVWAPHAQAVSVVGEFNEWDTEANPMKREEPLGIYTCFIPGVKKNQMYKYCIETYSGEQIFKADPYAVTSEVRPATASIISSKIQYKWNDRSWMMKSISRCLSMRHILVPGCAIRDGKMKVSIHIESLPEQLPNILKKWVIHMWS